ncbi:MAG: SUMF1/EgtB/PvdO family nonheme iron enzyme [Chloroflexaceae bacterium]|nr:SUMF1/EgtB/PvdO family nonheme iron enzyme [Chloroflexaceae bacterium]
MIVRTAYLAWLRSELRLLPVIPIKAADRAARLPLADVYVPLRVIERAQIEEFQRLTRGEFEPEREYRQRAEALEKLKQSERVFALFSDTQPGAGSRKGRGAGQSRVERMLLIGDAGSGKTTTLHFGALTLADALLRNDPAGVVEHLGFRGNPLPLPVYMRLTLAMKWLRDTPEGRQCAPAADPLLAWLDSQVAPQVAEFLKLREEQPVETSAGEPELPSPAAWQAALTSTPLSALVRAGGCLLLLDGLDETGDAPRRSAMQEWIAGLVRSCPKNRYLVASRPFKEIGIPGFVERHLSPLNSDEMQKLLNNWFGAAYRNDPGRPQQRSVSDEVGYLWGILERNPRLFDMCTNPLLLTSVALLVYTGVGLPRERAELYNRLVYLLLETWRILQLSGGKLPESQAAKPVLFGESVGSVQRRLQTLAAWMQETQRREVTLEEIVARLAPRYAADMEWSGEEARAYVARLLDSLALDSGILQRRDAGYSFSHYTLQEYLTARNFDQRPDGVDRLLALRKEARWKETILLAVGHWATSGVTDKARQFLRGLLDTNEPEALLLAGEALDDADASRVPELAPIHRAATARLRALAALTDDWRAAAHPDPVLRNRAATMLDRLDADTDRPGLDLAKDDYWAARIEPGTFSMSDKKNKFDHTIRRPYALARFPVTNRQYLLFVEALAGRGAPEAVAAAQKLLPLMKQHKQTPEQFRPRYWPGARYQAGEGNHPVGGVTWYAATAFAWWVNAWLHALGALRADEEVRLPTEAEWERAAAYPLALPGGDPRAGRREYPWGDRNVTETLTGGMIASIRANTSESGIDGTSVVGIFPHGAAACDAQDMAGNVWEWCSTPLVPYPFEGEVDAETLYTANKRASKTYVLRGGSWNSYRVNARCAYRFADYPGGVTGIFGLRLARLFSLPSS